MKLKGFIAKYGEPLTWAGALIALFVMNPADSGFSLCPLKALGISWCPGCGIGHSIHYTLHLNLQAAWHAHILGIPATLVLIYQVIKYLPFTNKNNSYGPANDLKYNSGH